MTPVPAGTDRLRLLLYEVMREVPTSAAEIAIHQDRQRLHRRVIAELNEEDPGKLVPSDYWLGRFPVSSSPATTETSET